MRISRSARPCTDRRGHGIEKSVAKYLARHAEPEARILGAIDGTPTSLRFGHVLVVPAAGERECLFRALASIPESPRGRVLTILVVNDASDSPQWIRDANRETLDRLRDENAPRLAIGESTELRDHRRGALLLIDRTAPRAPFPARQGVGLARKIGADCALALWARGSLESSWIHTSDADAILPTDYFARIDATGKLSHGASACLYDFEHEVVAGNAGRAVLRYEIFLRYYVLGLASANSPYAFHTIGSTLAIDGNAYARVHGFPRRVAAEDFYLLNKLAKLGRIEKLRGAPIRLSGRNEVRTPFGTAAALARELERNRKGETLPAYDPRVFRWLRVWLNTLTAATAGGEAPQTEGAFYTLLKREASRETAVDAAQFYAILEDLGAIREMIEILTAPDHRYHRAARIRERFDALRTLKLVHALRDRLFPSIPLEQALENANFLDNLAGKDLERVREILAARESSSKAC